MYIRIRQNWSCDHIWLLTRTLFSFGFECLYGGDARLITALHMSSIGEKTLRLVRGNTYAVEIDAKKIELKYISSIDCILKNLFKDSPDKVGFLAMKYKKGGYTPANKISKFAKSLFSSIIKYDPKIIFDAASWMDVEKRMAKVLNSIIKGSVLDDTKEDSK